MAEPTSDYRAPLHHFYRHDLFTDGINTADVSKINQAAAELTVGNAQIEATTQKIQNVLTP